MKQIKYVNIRAIFDEVRDTSSLPVNAWSKERLPGLDLRGTDWYKPLGTRGHNGDAVVLHPALGGRSVKLMQKTA